MAEISPDGLKATLHRDSEPDILGQEPISSYTGLEVSKTDAISRALHSDRPLGGLTLHGTVPNSYERILGEGQYHPEWGNDYTQYILSQQQSGARQFGSFLNQAIVGEVLGGTIEGIGYLSDFKQYADIIKGTEQEWGNALSDVGRAIKDWTREATPVFVNPTQDAFAMNRLSWWMSNGASIASTLSLLLPAIGTVKAVSTAGKAAKIGFGSKNFATLVDNLATKYGPEVATKFAKGSELFATGVGQAIVSRHMENLMEASQVYEEAMHSTGSKEDAARAASNTYNKQWLLLAQDIPQYLLFNKLAGKGVGNQAKSKSVAAFLGYDANKIFANKTASVLKTMLGEAGEEGYQFIVNEQSKLLAESGVDPAMKHSLLDVMKDQYDNGELYTSMFFGAMGAGVMLGSGAAMNKKGEAKAAEAQIKDLKQTGLEYNAAYQAYSEALETGDPIRQEAAWNEMTAKVGLSSVLHNTTEEAKDMFRQLADPDNNEAFERFGIPEQAGGLLQQKPELVEQLSKDIDRIAYLYNRYARETKANKDIKTPKEKEERAQLLTLNKFLMDKTEEQLEKSDQRVDILRNGMEEFFNMTPTGQDINLKTFQRRALKKPIAFLEKQLKRDDLGDKQKAEYEFILALRKLEDQRIKQDIDELRKEYSKEARLQDDKIKKGLDLNQVDEYVSEFARNRYIQSSLDQLKAHEEKYREGSPLASKQEKEDHVEFTKEQAHDPENDMDVDDIVSWENEDGSRSVGMIDSFELAETDSEGNEITPSADNADNIFNVVLLDKNGVPTKDVKQIRQRHLNVEDKRKYIQDTSIDPLSEQEEAISGLYNAREADGSRGTPQPITNLSYSNIADDNSREILIRNEELNKVLSDPTTDYTGATAEYYIDVNDPETKKQINQYKKSADEKTVAAIDRWLKGKATAADIDLLTKTNTGNKFQDLVDNIRIQVAVNLKGRAPITGGMYLHASGFDYIRPTAKVLKEARTDSGAINRYKEVKKKEAREVRKELFALLIEGKTPVTKNLKIGRGAPITELGANSNISAILNVKAKDLKLGIVKSGITENYVGELHTGENTVHNNVGYSSPGAIHAITSRTINGDEYALKLNRSRIGEEQASILFEAFRLLGITSLPTSKKPITPGGRYFTQFMKEDDRVEGLSAGQVVDLLVIHGKELTDPNSSGFKSRSRNKRHLQALANKRLYLTTDRVLRKAFLVYGNNPVTGEGYRIDLANATEADRQEFVKWAMRNKNYANHLVNKSLKAELNGGLLNGRPFRIGKKNPLVQKKGGGYNEFLINNNIITTDAVVNKETGLAFHAPTLDMGIYNTKGETTIKTGTRKSVIPTTKPAEETKVKKPVTKKKTGTQTVKTQEQLEQDVKNIQDEIKDLRGEDGSIAKKDMPRFKTLKEQLAVAQRKAQRGSSTKVIFLKKFEEGADRKTADPKVVTGKAKIKAADTIERIIQNSKTAEEAIRKVQSLGYAFDINAGHLFALYVQDRFDPSAPTVGNNKSSFQLWVEGKTEETAVEKKQADIPTSIEKAPKDVQVLLNTIDPTLKQVDEVLSGLQFDLSSELPNSVRKTTEAWYNYIENRYKNGLSNKADLETEETISESIPDDAPLPSLDDLMGDFNGDTDGFFSARNYSEYDYVKQDLEKELAWLAKKIGIKVSNRKEDLTDAEFVKVVKDLGELTRKGKDNFGLFTKNGILLWEAAEEGTVYHEAFHQVSMLYLTEGQRKALYRAARAFYKMPKATDAQIEEVLAENFREYVINREENKPTTVLARIGEFFKNLFNLLRSFFVGTNKLTNLEVETIFKQIYEGRFRFSKATQESIDRLGNDAYTRGVGGREFATIASRKQINSIVKSLAFRLLKGNNVEDLNRVKDLKWEPVFKSVDSFIKNAERLLEKGELSEAEATRVSRKLDTFKEIYADMQLDNKPGDRSVLLDRVRSYLRDIGITNRVVEQEVSDDPNDDPEVVGTFSLDKRSSWEVSSKDNAMSSVKFMVAMLHKNAEIDPDTGLREFVDFNTIWHRLLERVHSYETIDQMIDELNDFGSETEEGYPYIELANVLDQAGENAQNQFLTTFRKHRHEFINFIFRYTSNNGVTMDITNTSLDKVFRDTALTWNERFYLDTDIVTTDKDGRKTLNEKFFEAAYNKYQDIVDDMRIVKEIDDNSYETEQEIVERIVDVLNDLHIGVDVDTIQAFINDKSGATPIDMIDSAVTDLRSILEGKFLASARAKEVLPRIPGSFMKNPVITELSKIYSELHPEERSDVVLGAGNNKYFTYAGNNMITDIVRRITDRAGYIEDKQSKIYNRGSLIFEQLLADPKKLEEFGVLTFSKLASGRGFDTGRDFIGITRLEDYLVKFSAIMNGYLTLPVLADRKQYYVIKGIDGYKNVIIATKEDDSGKPTFTFSDEVLDRFYKYYLDEKDRIKAAKDLRKRYLAAKGEEQELLKRQLIKNYHYTGNFNVNSKKANAYNFIHFKGFKLNAPASEIKTEINNLLTKYVNEEISYAAQIDIIGKDGNELEVKTMDGTLIEEAEVDIGTTEAIRRVFGDYVVGNMVSIMESEKVFFADPAFFKQNKDSSDVTEDMYKRWFGPGSTGQNLAESTESFPNEWYNVVTLNTQSFESEYYPALVAKHAELYERILKDKPANKDKSAEEIAKEAEHLAELALSAYKDVDPTDGQVFISNEMYKSIATRLGEWNPDKEAAYQLLISDMDLTASEEVQALNVVLQPLKLVYIGKESDGELDTVVYDKMSMATIFRRQVKGKHLEALVDRMEDETNPVHAFKFDSAVKIGGRMGVDLFKDGSKRDEVADLDNLPIYKQYFENLKFQVVTDTHEAVKQTVGTQMFKIAMMNVLKKVQYGEFENGQALLDSITRARAEISDVGAEEIRARFGFKNGMMSDEALIKMLKKDAEEAGKSDDFQQALKLDENGKQWLQLDSFADRRWVYSRIVSMVTSSTVDLNMPGKQLIQVSDYGSVNRETNNELGFIISERGDTTVYEMEARVTINLFDHLIPNELITFEDRAKFIQQELKIIGYRIPTQGQNSIVRLKIIEVLPSQAGDVIQLPLEFTALTGSDFDIDKLFAISYNYRKSYEGKEPGALPSLEKVPFLTGDGTFEERYKTKKAEYDRIHKGERQFMSEEQFANLSIEKQNTREANQNRILDAFYTVLGHEEHFLETTTPLGRLTNKLKKKAEEYERLQRGGVSPELGPLESVTPRYQSETKFIFTGSKTGIGPFALANANHALTQHAGIQYKSELQFGFNENGILEFDRMRGEDDISISDWLSALIDAHVDAVKDPYIIKLNVNSATYDVVNFLLRAGVGEDTFALLSQPILREYAQEFFNANGKITVSGRGRKSAERAAFETIQERWLLEYGLDEEEIGDFQWKKSDINKIDLPIVLNKTQLRKDISSKQDRDKAFLTRQLNVLQHFMDILSESKDLTKLTMASRVDTKKFGSTPTELRNFLNQIKYVENSGKWINLEKLIQSNGELVEGGTMLSPLLKNSILLTLELLSNKSIYSSLGFSTIFWELLNSIPNGSTAMQSTVNNLTEELFSYFVGQFFADPVDGLGMSDPNKLRTILMGSKKSVFAELDKIKSGRHKFSEELKDNKVIQALTVDHSSDSPFQTYLKMPFHTLKDKWETDDYIDDFRELFTHKDESVRDFARRLFIYSYYSSGFRNRYHSFHSYIPLDVLKELEALDNQGNRKKVSFDNYIKKLLTELNDYSAYNAHVLKAKREVFTNNWYNNTIVPEVSSDTIFETFEKDNNEVGFILDLRNEPQLILGVNNNEEKIYAPFLTMLYFGQTILMEFSGHTKGKPVYRIVRKKGFQHRGVVLKEYGVESDRSVIDPTTTAAEIKERDRLNELPEEEKRDLFNWIYTVSEEEFANVVTSAGNLFKRIPFNNQFVTDVAPSQNSFNMDYRGGLEEGMTRVNKSRNWENLKKLSVYSSEGIMVMRKKYTDEHFGNPFTVSGVKGLIQLDSTEQASQAYRDWLTLPINKETDFNPTNVEESKRFERMKYVFDNLNNVKVSIGGTSEFMDQMSDALDSAKVETNTGRYTITHNTGSFVLDFKAGGISNMPSGLSDIKLIVGLGKYIELLQNHKSSQKEWILSQIEQGKLDGETLLYMNKDKGQYYSHADALADIVNERINKTDQINNIKTTSQTESFSLPNNRIEIFADGSAIRDRNHKLIDYGYGAYFKWNNEAYRISGNREKVNELMKDFVEEGAEVGGFANPTTELLATYEALKAFENTAEHITILQDFEGAINYGNLWERSAGSENRSVRAKTPNAPHIKYVVSLIEDVIDRIERNGGSVKLKWIPTNHGAYDRKVAANPKTFSDDTGKISQNIVDKYAAGNSMANSMANDKKNRNSFSQLGAPEVNPSDTRIFSEEEQNDETSKNNCKQ